MLKEIRESGYDQELVYNFIRELLNSDKQIKEKNNLELIDNYLLDKDPQELSKNAAEIVICLLYTSPSPRDREKSRMPSSA